MLRRSECSGWWTTGPPTAAKPRLIGWPAGSERGDDAYAGARLLAGPNRGLFRGGATQGRVPSDFTDLAEVEQRLIGFEQRYNTTARPFLWKFTRDDLRDLLARIDQHEQQEAAIKLQSAA